MSPAPAYAYGDPITRSEFLAVRSCLLPKRRSRLHKLSPEKFLAAAYHLAPARLEHEVNRKRGIAHDAGENGFSYSVVT